MSADLAQRLRRLAEVSRKGDIVVFAGRVGGRLMDNVKYLYLHCLRHQQPFTPVFLTHFEAEHRLLADRGLPSVLFPGDDALAVLPRARLVVADDFWFKTQTPAWNLLHLAHTVQIWHGIPLKLIGFPEIESGVNMTPEKAEHLRDGYSGYDAAVSTSPFVTETSLGRVFEAKHMWETGYPRNDVLLREPHEHELLGADQDTLARVRGMRAAGYKVVFYMPTFRDTGGDAFNDGALDPAALEALGREHKVAFVLKFHPYVQVRADLGLKTVHLAASDADAYPLLREADCLLTDYSSVAYDYLLTDRPQVFFPYDLDKYRSRDRGLFYPYEAMAPGPRPTSQDALLDVLRSVLVHGADEHAGERAELKARLFTHHDAKACERLAGRIAETFFA